MVAIWRANASVGKGETKNINDRSEEVKTFRNEGMHVPLINSSHTSGNTWYLEAAVKRTVLLQTPALIRVQIQRGVRDDVERGQVDENKPSS